MVEEAQKNLIPGLPDEIAMECLIKVPYQFHWNMKSVCHSWHHLISSPSFYQERIKSATAEHLVCQIQPLPSQESTNITHTSIATSKSQDNQHGQQHIHTPPQYYLTIYNATHQTWQRILRGIPMFCQCVALQSSGKLVLLGGWDPTTLEPVPDVYVVDMLKGSSLKRVASMSVARSFFACAVVGESTVYVAGGHDNQKNALKSAEVYDVETDVWKMLPEMEEERDECQGMCWEGDDRFWVVSGYGTECQGRFKSDAEYYDPVTGFWSKFDGLWPFPSISPRGTTTTTSSNNGNQHQWLWFLAKEQQQLLQESEQQNGGVKEFEDKERKWEMVSSIVQLPNSIIGVSPCVSVTTLGLGKQRQRVFVMSGNGSREPSSSPICNQCEGGGGFIMEIDRGNGQTKWNHLHTPLGFSGFSYSASYLLI